MTIDVTFDLIDKLQKCIQDLKDEIKDRDEVITDLRKRLGDFATQEPVSDGSDVRVWNAHMLGTDHAGNINLDGSTVVHFFLGDDEVEMWIDKSDGGSIVVESDGGVLIESYNGCGVRVWPGNG